MSTASVGDSRIREAVAACLPRAQALLAAMIEIPSTSGKEDALMEYLERVFREAGLRTERCPMHDSLLDHPDYSSPVPGIRYDGRFNLRVTRAGVGGGGRLLFNAHTDVVPPSEGMQHPWSARLEDGVMYGRGACDDKGQIALLYLVLICLDALGVQTGGDVVAHLVTEEENGGNGSLAMVGEGEQADACIVLEPTEQRLLTAIRGAVWFRVTLHGVAGHSGSAGQTRSALLLARDAIGALEAYHARLLAASRGIPLFDPHANPMPITFGRLQAGNWPATAPDRAVLEGVLGFLPNRTKEQVCAEMRAALLAGGLRETDFTLEFMYRHDCSVLDPGHPLVQGLLASAEACGRPTSVAAMTASCDAWFYRNMLEIPTLVFGAGTLKVAHSAQESIRLDEIAGAAEILTQFVMDSNKGGGK